MATECGKSIQRRFIMPSQINNPGNVVNVTANYLVTKPSTRFSTRQLAFFDIQVTGIATNYETSNSVFSQVVRGVQAVAEIYAVGTPNSDHVIVVVAGDTTSGEHTVGPAMSQTIADAVGNSATVTYVGLYGNGFDAILGSKFLPDGSYEDEGSVNWD